MDAHGSSFPVSKVGASSLHNSQATRPREECDHSRESPESPLHARIVDNSRPIQPWNFAIRISFNLRLSLNKAVYINSTRLSLNEAGINIDSTRLSLNEVVIKEKKWSRNLAQRSWRKPHPTRIKRLLTTVLSTIHLRTIQFDGKKQQIPHSAPQLFLPGEGEFVLYMWPKLDSATTLLIRVHSIPFHVAVVTSRGTRRGNSNS